MAYSVRRFITLAAAFGALQNGVSAAPGLFVPNKRTYCPTTTVTVTETATATFTAVPTATCPPPQPQPFDCSKYGYLVNDYAFYEVDLATSERRLITPALNDRKYMNAIGYNILDNYIYGREAGTGGIIRITQDGTSTKVATVPSIQSYFIGDIDGSGRYWVSGGLSGAGTNSWTVIDLNPFSTNFGKIIESGTSTLAGGGVGFADWTFIPSAGNFLWSLAVEDGHGVLIRFNMNNKAWAKVKEFPGFPATGFGACFASNNGDLYCDQNSTGRIYKINVFTQARPVLVSTGAIVSNADGARCVFNTAQI